ncbi:unnamed protein product [Choristocarpus tenellus]
MSSNTFDSSDLSFNRERPNVTRKRQHRGDGSCCGRTRPFPRVTGVSAVRSLFLPTHLVLLRALYSCNTDVECESTRDKRVVCGPQPPWEEVETFVNDQASLLEGRSKMQRAAMVLSAVSGHVPLPSPPSVAPPSVACHGAGCGPKEVTRNDFSSCSMSTLAHLAGPRPTGVHGGGDVFPAVALDPRSVVCAVLRRSALDHRIQHNRGVGKIKNLRRVVQEIIEFLHASLGHTEPCSTLEVPIWVNSDLAVQTADNLERQANKLVLWQRLHRAILSCYSCSGDSRITDPQDSNVRR